MKKAGAEESGTDGEESDDEDAWVGWEVASDSDSSSSSDGWIDVSSDSENVLEISDSEDEKGSQKKNARAMEEEEEKDEDDSESNESDSEVEDGGDTDEETEETEKPADDPVDLSQSIAATKVRIYYISLWLVLTNLYDPDIDTSRLCPPERTPF